MDGHTGGRGPGGGYGLVWGSGSGHTSQEVTPAMLDYKQCALSTSAVFTVEHTISPTAKGVVLVGGRKDAFSLSLSLMPHPFSESWREWVGWGSRARKALH